MNPNKIIEILNDRPKNTLAIWETSYTYTKYERVRTSYFYFDRAGGFAPSSLWFDELTGTFLPRLQEWAIPIPDSFLEGEWAIAVENESKPLRRGDADAARFVGSAASARLMGGRPYEEADERRSTIASFHVSWSLFFSEAFKRQHWHPASFCRIRDGKLVDRGPYPYPKQGEWVRAFRRRSVRQLSLFDSSPE